jgi:pyruvate dehydrogenase E2 component (dihydrolipoamide acetyltransferase)
MATPVIMPRQGQSVETCIMGHWYKKPGESVNEGDILFSYETDKASFEEEAKVKGILLATFFHEGDEVPVLTNVAVIGKEGESTDAFRPGSEPDTTEEKEQRKEASFSADRAKEPDRTEQEKESEKLVAKDERVRISPLARNMAASLGFDIHSVKGTGPHGRIIARDIEKGVQEGTAKPVKESGVRTSIIEKGSDFEVRPIPHIRKLIARAMHQSLQHSAQLTHHMSADARKLLALRKKFKADLEADRIGQNITINDLVCYIVVRVLREFPKANTHYLGDAIQWFSKVHLGVAVDTDRGLMVPAVRNADDLSLEGLSSQLAVLAGAARSGNIDPDLLKPEAATFTVSNLGNYGVEMFTPIVNLPQTAILGVCTILPRPKDLGDGVYGFVPAIGLSLSYDHQALDGGEATLFLAEIKKQIENISV